MLATSYPFLLGLLFVCLRVKRKLEHLNGQHINTHINNLFLCQYHFIIVIRILCEEKGEYESIKSKAFIKDIWTQRKIYAPLIVHFYDTATDIGVIIYWYGLMIDETEKGIDYRSVNMTVFFWCGISFLLVYRVLTLLFVALDVMGCDLDLNSDWYDIILVLLDVYIFKAVCLNFFVALFIH